MDKYEVLINVLKHGIRYQDNDGMAIRLGEAVLFYDECGIRLFVRPREWILIQVHPLSALGRTIHFAWYEIGYAKPLFVRDSYHVIANFWNEGYSIKNELSDPPIATVAATRRAKRKAEYVSVLRVSVNRKADWPLLAPVWDNFLKWLKEAGKLYSEEPKEEEEGYEWRFRGTPSNFSVATWQYSMEQIRKGLLFPVFYDQETIIPEHVWAPIDRNTPTEMWRFPRPFSPGDLTCCLLPGHGLPL